MYYYLKKFLGGVVFCLGIVTTALIASTIPLAFSDGETLSANKLNLMVTAITELQSRVDFGGFYGHSFNTIYQADTDGFVMAIGGNGYGMYLGSTSPPGKLPVLGCGWHFSNEKKCILEADQSRWRYSLSLLDTHR